MVKPQSPGRGRPATTTAHSLAQTALTLWDERGYENVPLSAVATAAGVTERTLFRYFKSKSDIVWQAIDTSFSDLHSQLAGTPTDLSLISRIRLGILATFDPDDDDQLTRLRMRVIGRAPELHNNSSPPFIAWRTVIRQFIAEELDIDPDELTAHVAASGIQAVTMSALIWWGSHGDGEAVDTVDRALGQLEHNLGFDPA
jgi:AcrR family transcriptional regulator